MQFRIADTFIASLARLTAPEQKVVKTKAFDLQMNPDNPGMRFHRLGRAKDKSFWSVRVSRDIRIIVHKTVSSLMLCFVAHHDAAYRWAERRRIQQHPKTGAAQFVVVPERLPGAQLPAGVQAALSVTVAPTPGPFASLTEDALLSYGVPTEWLKDVRGATEESFLNMAEELPEEAAEALLVLATGGTPQVPVPADQSADPFTHPDAQRRFRVMTNVEELERALASPWDRWTVFLHPAQRRTVEGDYQGPARVSGSAGTGKTIVALHRAVYLARLHPEARVLLATFSETLARALEDRLQVLIGNEPRVAERLEVHSLGSLGRRLYRVNFGEPVLATEEHVRELLRQAAGEVEGHRFSSYFLWTEWATVVDAWQLEDWEAYRDVKRLGRKTRLAETQRTLAWAIFEKVRAALSDEGLLTEAAMFGRLERWLGESKGRPYDFAVIDEAQDVGVAELRFLAALGGERPNGLFLAGDLGQRIFQTPFSWAALGVEVRGRSRTLRINYRTSHQIRRQADRLLPAELSDVDGNTEDRRGTVSVFNGPEPRVLLCASVEAEGAALAEWLGALTAEGFAPREIGVFVRSQAEIPRVLEAVQGACLEAVRLEAGEGGKTGYVSVGTMHLAKGLEFRAVAVAACDDEVIPLQSRMESVADEADLEDVYNTERHLLYVACTRARDRLLVSGVEPGSEFLEDMRGRTNLGENHD